MKFLFYPIIIPVLALVAVGFRDVVEIVYSDPGSFLWMFIGIAALSALVLIPPIRRNIGIFRIFTHELTHTVVCLMFFRKILSFNVNKDGGVVYHTGAKRGEIFINLAPYCLPIYTFAFAIIRLLASEGSLFIFDILIGFTLAFHIICYAKETRPKQTDIKKSGYLRSLLFIPTALMFNLSIIMLTVLSDFGNAFAILFTGYWESITEFWELIF